MIAHLSHVMTLANSIIGVSVLAMPFCFKQCGIVLAILVLLKCSVLSRLACHFLIKSAVMSRRRNFEFLAFHAFGTTGKFVVELFIIGFLLGTCIAFFVVVGDLGPQIIGKLINKNSEDIRTSVLVTTATFIVLPLGLLRNIDSLSSLSTATIGFYFCLVLKVVCESTRHIYLGDWYRSVVYWRPAGILQCLPIFSMALFCQTQLFEIYEALPNACLEKMNQVVRGALNICTGVYLCVGFFGYAAFCNQPFTGNILMSFEPSWTSDVIKMGFVFSVAFSFPLVIFPCRASLNSLLFRKAHTHESTTNYIPEVRFRCLTLAIVLASLGTGILIPNIEFILGIVGSTIGVMICLIFPAAFFIAISTKNTNERLIAQAIIFFGMWIMVLGTYANIYALEESSNVRNLINTENPFAKLDDNPLDPLNKIVKDEFSANLISNEGKSLDALGKLKIAESLDKLKIVEPLEKLKIAESLDVRREPPIPVEAEIAAQLLDKKLTVPILASLEKASVDKEVSSDLKKWETLKKAEIDSEAIKKEETELAAAIDLEAEVRHEKLRQTLEKHQREQMEMMLEQKQLLKDIKEQKQEFEAEKRRLANNPPENSGSRSSGTSGSQNATEGQASVSISGNANLDSRGPILSALTNRTLNPNPEIAAAMNFAQNETNQVLMRPATLPAIAVNAVQNDTSQVYKKPPPSPPIPLRNNINNNKNNENKNVKNGNQTGNYSNIGRDILQAGGNGNDQGNSVETESAHGNVQLTGSNPLPGNVQKTGSVPVENVQNNGSVQVTLDVQETGSSPATKNVQNGSDRLIGNVQNTGSYPVIQNIQNNGTAPVAQNAPGTGSAQYNGNNRQTNISVGNTESPKTVSIDNEPNYNNNRVSNAQRVNNSIAPDDANQNANQNGQNVKTSGVENIPSLINFPNISQISRDLENLPNGLESIPQILNSFNFTNIPSLSNILNSTNIPSLSSILNATDISSLSNILNDTNIPNIPELNNILEGSTNVTDTNNNIPDTNKNILDAINNRRKRSVELFPVEEVISEKIQDSMKNLEKNILEKEKLDKLAVDEQCSIVDGVKDIAGLVSGLEIRINELKKMAVEKAIQNSTEVVEKLNQESQNFNQLLKNNNEKNNAVTRNEKIQKETTETPKMNQEEMKRR